MTAVVLAVLLSLLVGAIAARVYLLGGLRDDERLRLLANRLASEQRIAEATREALHDMRAEARRWLHSPR